MSNDYEFGLRDMGSEPVTLRTYTFVGIYGDTGQVYIDTIEAEDTNSAALDAHNLCDGSLELVAVFEGNCNAVYVND